jgi:hypothetical protein
VSKSPLSALILVGVAGVVGAFAWMALSDEAIESEASVVQMPSATDRSGPKVMALTPHERRLQGRLEGAKREIEKYKEEGRVLESGTIVVPDVDGSPLYIHPELIKGKGRYGEPLYAMAKYKKRPALPLTTPKNLLPAKNQPKVAKAKKGTLTFGTKPTADGETGVGNTSAGGGAEGGKGKNKGKGKTKPGDG